MTPCSLKLCFNAGVRVALSGPSSTCVAGCKRPATGRKKNSQNPPLSCPPPPQPTPQQHSFSNPTERCFQFAQRPCRGGGGGPTDQTHQHTNTHPPPLSLTLHVSLPLTHTADSELPTSSNRQIKGTNRSAVCAAGIRLKGRSSSLNISGDWLEVNRALNPAKLWQGQYGRRTKARPGISEPLFSA